MASFCATLGVTCVLFIRVRQRALKALSVISVGMVGSAAVVRSIWADPGLFSLVVVSFCLLLFLTSPFLVHAFVGREEEPKEAPLSRSS
jgi:hypothetical protein